MKLTYEQLRKLPEEKLLTKALAFNSRYEAQKIADSIQAENPDKVCLLQDQGDSVFILMGEKNARTLSAIEVIFDDRVPFGEAKNVYETMQGLN